MVMVFEVFEAMVRVAVLCASCSTPPLLHGLWLRLTRGRNRIVWAGDFDMCRLKVIELSAIM